MVRFPAGKIFKPAGGHLRFLVLSFPIRLQLTFRAQHAPRSLQRAGVAGEWMDQIDSFSVLWQGSCQHRQGQPMLMKFSCLKDSSFRFAGSRLLSTGAEKTLNKFFSLSIADTQCYISLRRTTQWFNFSIPYAVFTLRVAPICHHASLLQYH